MSNNINKVFGRCFGSRSDSFFRQNLFYSFFLRCLFSNFGEKAAEEEAIEQILPETDAAPTPEGPLEKILAQAEAAFSIDDTKDPSTEASSIGGKFFTDISENGGRGMAHEIMKKSEKDIHDTREAAKAAEKAVELERRISIT
jgi:hypothetical protein